MIEFDCPTHGKVEIKHLCPKCSGPFWDPVEILELQKVLDDLHNQVLKEPDTVNKKRPSEV